MSKPMTPFQFGVLNDEKLRVTLMGMFSHSQLMVCEYDGVAWKRQAGETAEEMERRVCEDVREMMHGAHQPQTALDNQHSFVE